MPIQTTFFAHLTTFFSHSGTAEKCKYLFNPKSKPDFKDKSNDT